MKGWIVKTLWFPLKLNTRMCLDPDFSPDEQEEKARLISQVFIFQRFIIFDFFIRLTQPNLNYLFLAKSNYFFN